MQKLNGLVLQLLAAVFKYCRAKGKTDCESGRIWPFVIFIWRFLDFSRMLLLTPNVSFTSKFFTPLFIKTGARPWRELGTIQPRPGQQFFLSSKAGKEEAIRNHLMIYMGNKCNLFSCDNLESKHQPPALTGDSSGCAFSTSHPVFLDMSLLKCSCHNHPHLLLTLLDQMPLTTSISR